MSMSQNMLLSNEDYGLLLSRDFYIMSFIMTEGKKTRFHFNFHFHLYIKDVTASNISKVKIKQRVEPKSTFISTWNGPLQVDRVIEKKWGNHKQRQEKTKLYAIIYHLMSQN